MHLQHRRSIGVHFESECIKPNSKKGGSMTEKE